MFVGNSLKWDYSMLVDESVKRSSGNLLQELCEGRINKHILSNDAPSYNEEAEDIALFTYNTYIKTKNFNNMLKVKGAFENGEY